MMRKMRVMGLAILVLIVVLGCSKKKEDKFAASVYVYEIVSKDKNANLEYANYRDPEMMEVKVGDKLIEKDRVTFTVVKIDEEGITVEIDPPVVKLETTGGELNLGGKVEYLILDQEFLEFTSYGELSYRWKIEVVEISENE